MTREQIERRIDQLKQDEYQLSAQLHAVQGAIYELEGYWLPLVDKPEEPQKDALTVEELEQALGGKVEL